MERLQQSVRFVATFLFGATADEIASYGISYLLTSLTPAAVLAVVLTLLDFPTWSIATALIVVTIVLMPISLRLLGRAYHRRMSEERQVLLALAKTGKRHEEALHKIVETQEQQGETLRLVSVALREFRTTQERDNEARQRDIADLESRLADRPDG